MAWVAVVRGQVIFNLFQALCPFECENADAIILDITFTEEYPVAAPKFKLSERDVARIYHPNVSDAGSICQVTVTKSQENSLTVRERLDAFVNLLSHPNPDSPYDGECAKLIKTNKRLYYRLAKAVFTGEITKQEAKNQCKKFLSTLQK